ncbi:hypothetical protein TAMA11512_20320 [Selenomonas sp. TAMA-11512]|nr:hypothetical protein TAMA11512_20320 [Selenomonas sp. TAMA-11512]
MAVSGTAAASDEDGWRFVDARGTTGYYVDTWKISIDSDHEYTAVVLIIKAKEDLLYRYRIHFDYAKRTYQILSSKTMSYETREVKSSSDTPLPPEPYQPGSPMQAIVDYIYAWHHGMEK